ncbi:helicase HerA-like domain-containing protein [Escherichia coli]
MFNDAPQVLLNKIEQVITLIRSKGVGVWFVSVQNPVRYSG